MLTKFLLEFWYQDADQIFAWILISLGTLFIEFCFEVGRPGDQKTLIFLRFFSFFIISTNLPTRSHMIDFLVNLALNLALKIHQKSTQEPPKNYKKSIKNYIQNMTPFFIDFFSILEASWAPSWTYVEAMFAKKPSKKQLRQQHQKNTKKTNPRKNLVRVGPGSWGPLN